MSPPFLSFSFVLILAYYQDVQEMLKDLLGDTLQGMLEAEMDQKLGYSKYDYQNKETDDSRNGYSHKTVTSSMGDIDLDIPRDRRGEFEPQIVKKHQTDISKILYLAMTDITKKWTGKTWDWGQTLDQLCIYFGDRIQPEDLE